MSVVGYTLNGLVFNSGVVDADGSMWWAQLDGWASAEQSLVMLDPSGKDVVGSVVGSSRYKGRPLVLRGTCETANAAGYWRSRDALSVVADIEVPSSLIVGEVVPKQVDVIRAGRLQMSEHGPDTGWFDFQLPLLAPNPFKLATDPFLVLLAETLPTIRSAVAVGGVSGTAVLTVPSGSAAGDVMWVFLNVDSSTVSAAPAGWSLVSNVAYTGGNHYIYRRVAGAGEPASYTWTLAAADEWLGCTVTVRESDTAVVGTTSNLQSNVAADLVWPVNTPAPRSLRLFGAGYSSLSTPTTPAGLHLVTNAGTGTAPDASAVLVAASHRGSGVVDAVATRIPISAQKAGYTFAVNVPPSTPPAMVAVGGTAPTPPTLTVVGPTTYPLVICNHERCVRIDVALTATDVLDIDFRHRRVRLNGVNRYDLVSLTSQWWELTPGANYLRGQDASTEADEENQWEASSGTARMSRSNDMARLGVSSTKIVATSAGTIQVRPRVPRSRPGIIAGNTYSVTADLRPGVTARTFDVRISWLNSAGGIISTVDGPDATEVVHAWVTAAHSAVAPAGAISAAIEVRINGVLIGEDHYLDRVGMFAGGLPVTYDAREANVIDYSGGGTARLRWREASL